jgi:hypothetical protein
MIIFSRPGHCMCVCRWGRRFRLPTPYVHTQTASALASGYFGGDLSVCYLAIGWVYAEGSVYAGVGRRKRLPHFHFHTYTHGWAIVCCGRSRNGQGCLWACLAERCPSGPRGGRCTFIWREREVFLSASGLGDHAQSCACAVASKNIAFRDYALGEGIYGAGGESHSRKNRRSLLAG